MGLMGKMKDVVQSYKYNKTQYIICIINTL